MQEFSDIALPAADRAPSAQDRNETSWEHAPYEANTSIRLATSIWNKHSCHVQNGSFCQYLGKRLAVRAVSNRPGPQRVVARRVRAQLHGVNAGRLDLRSALQSEKGHARGKPPARPLPEINIIEATPSSYIPPTLGAIPSVLLDSRVAALLHTPTSLASMSMQNLRRTPQMSPAIIPLPCACCSSAAPVQCTLTLPGRAPFLFPAAANDGA